MSEHSDPNVESLGSRFLAAAERAQLVALAEKWEALREVRDIGELGSAFDGYDRDGFRPLSDTELRLLSLCAKQLRAAAAVLAVPADTERVKRIVERIRDEAFCRGLGIC